MFIVVVINLVKVVLTNLRRNVLRFKKEKIENNVIFAFMETVQMVIYVLTYNLLVVFLANDEIFVLDVYQVNLVTP